MDDLQLGAKSTWVGRGVLRLTTVDVLESVEFCPAQSDACFFFLFLCVYTCEMFVASLTRRFVSAKRLFRDLQNL